VDAEAGESHVSRGRGGGVFEGIMVLLVAVLGLLAIVSLVIQEVMKP
jgi:hypothetical protein